MTIYLGGLGLRALGSVFTGTDKFHCNINCAIDLQEPTQNPYAEYAKAMYHMTQGNCPTEKIQNIGVLQNLLCKEF